MNKRMVLSAIKNGYTKSVDNISDLQMQIMNSLKKGQEISIVHYQSKTIIKVFKDSNGKWKTQKETL